MATLPGTNVAAKIVPFDSNDTFATHDEKYGLGGFRSVANQAERDSITSLRLKTGMLVYQLDENKYYRLTSTVQPISANWIETFVGTGSGGGDITRAEVAYISGNLQQQINNISSPSLSAYTLLVMTSDISGYLNNKINTISNSITGYTLLTTTSLISSGLSNRIDQNYSYISSISGKNNTQQLQIDGLVNLSGGVALKTDLVSVSGNLYSLTKEISGTSEGAYHIASNLMSTGIVSGGILTAATSSSFNISSGLGMIIDHTVLNGKNNPRANVYTWSAINNVSVTPFITAGVPYIFVGLDSNLNLHYATNEFTPQERRDYMELGKVSLRGGRVVAVVSKKGIPFDYGASIWDIGEALGALNLSGNVFSPSGNNLSITKSAGTSFRYSVNVDTNRKQPSLTTDPSLNPVTFFRAYRNAAFTDFTYVPNQTIVDPNYYDNGSGTLHTVGNNDWSVQRVYYFPSGGNTYVLYGQSTYSSLSLARSSISTENFQIPDDILNGSVFRGWLVVKEGATNLSSNSQSVFIPAGKFGTVGGGGASGAVSNHNDLANIQGGSLNQYYHLTASELNSISGFATNSLITSITGQFATITLVNGMSGVLQSNINSKVSADILRAEVSSISSSLQNNIDNFKTQVVGTTGNLQAQINTKIGDAPSDGNQYARKNAAWVIVTGVTGTGSSGAGFVPLAGTGMTITPSGNNYLFNVNDYISKTETRSISSGLQFQIDNLNTSVNNVTGQFATKTLVNGTSGVLQSNILGLTTSVNNVTAQFATITLVNGTSGVLQSNINAKVSADILRTEVSNISSGLQFTIDSFKTQVVGTTGDLQTQIYNVNTSVNNVTGQFATKTLVAGTSGVLQSNINTVSANLSDYQTIVQNMSSGLNNRLNTIEGSYITTTTVRNLTGNLQTQITTLTTAVTSISAIFKDTNEPTGFVDRTSSQISYIPSTRVFNISGASGFNIYSKGKKYSKTTDTTTVSGSYGIHYIKYDSSGIFNYSTIPWSIETDIPIAYVFVNDGASDSFITEERHGCVMDGVTHLYLHHTVGAKYKSGFILGDYATNSDSISANKYSVSAGDFFDEDILNTLPSISASGPYTLFYRTGVNGNWTWSKNQSYPYFINETQIQYNQNTGATWKLTNITTNNTWVNYYIVATNALTPEFKTVIIPGQTTYSSLPAALAEQITSLSLGTLPFQEVIAVARVTHRYGTGFSSTNGKARIDNVTYITNQSILINQGSAASTHNSLAGLQGGAAGEYYHLTLSQITNYIDRPEVQSISSNLQDQILFKKYTGYTALTSISGQSYPVLVGAVSGQPSSIDKLDASSSASYVSPLGFVTQNVSAGQQTSILWNGEISFPSSTFIPGLVAYANPYVFGAITQTKPVSSGQYIISVGTAKTDSILSVNIEDPYLISAIDSPAQDRAVYFRSPTQLGSITVEVGDILVLNDTSESHPNLLTTGNYIVYRCILQYIGDGNAINGSELLTNFLAIGNQPKYNQPVNFLDITPSGLGQNGLKVSKGELLIIDDSTVYSSVIPGSGNKNYYPTFVCTNPITGAGSTVSRSQIESNFRQLHDNKFKLSTTTNNNSSSVNLDFSSTTYEAYHITVKVMADGSTGYKFFATYQFGMTGEPIGAGGCTIQGALTEDILFNPLTELAVVFSDPGDALQITFNSTGRVGETYTWKAWVIVERF